MYVTRRIDSVFHKQGPRSGRIRHNPPRHREIGSIHIMNPKPAKGRRRDYGFSNLPFRALCTSSPHLCRDIPAPEPGVGRRAGTGNKGRFVRGIGHEVLAFCPSNRARKYAKYPLALAGAPPNPPPHAGKKGRGGPIVELSERATRPAPGRQSTPEDTPDQVPVLEQPAYMQRRPAPSRPPN